MKNSFIGLIMLCLFATLSYAQPVETGLLGDDFSLEGALHLFKGSTDLEDFEKKLNDEKSEVNNLDLNDDNDIDYIRIIDNLDGDVHAIVLQAVIDESESQDIAVIEIEKDGAESAILQIVGDEALYGENHYVEPTDEEGSSTARGPDGGYEIARITVNVWFWNPVRYIYRPNYNVYVSPWSWAKHPKWWNPWRPLTWNIYNSRRARFGVHFRVAPVHRVVRAHRIYTPVKRTSITVKKKSKTRIVSNKNGGSKKAKVSSKTVTKTNGNTKVTKTKTTKKVAASNGKGKKTKVTKTKTKKKKKKGDTKKVKKTKKKKVKRKG